MIAFISKLSEFTKIILVYILSGLAGIFFSLITEKSICIFLNFTGLPCPACGMTHAFIALLNADFKSAIKYHPLFILVIIFPFLTLSINGEPILEESLKNKILIIFLSAFLLLWIWNLTSMFLEYGKSAIEYSSLIPKFIVYIKNNFRKIYS